MNILVTGITGFVGKELSKKLSERGDTVWGTIRRSSREGSKVQKDRRQIPVNNIDGETDWRNTLLGIDTVIHLAARIHVMADQAVDPLAEFRRVNTAGTLHLARQAARAGIRRLVYLSSIKVNGEVSLPNQPFRPDDNPAPEDDYSLSKCEAEQGLLQLSRETGMEVVIIRPPLVYGPGVKANFLSMMQWLSKGVPLPLGAIYGNKRSLVALDNLVDFIITCIDHPAAAANQTFLVADGQDFSTTELLTRTAKALGKPARLLPIPQRFLTFMLKMIGKDDLAHRLCGSLQVDISKARDLLGWTPPVTMDEGLRKTAQAFLAAQRNH